MLPKVRQAIRVARCNAYRRPIGLGSDAFDSTAALRALLRPARINGAFTGHIEPLRPPQIDLRRH